MLRHPATPLVALSCATWQTGRTYELLTRAARTRPVIVVEPAVSSEFVALRRDRLVRGLTVVRPQIPGHLDGVEMETLLAELLTEVPELAGCAAVDLWICSPLSTHYADDLPVRLTVFDYAEDRVGCPGAPENLSLRQRDLFGVADVVIADGSRLFAKAVTQHANVHCIPSVGEQAPGARQAVGQQPALAAPDAAEELWDLTWAQIDRAMAEALGQAPHVDTYMRCPW